MGTHRRQPTRALLPTDGSGPAAAHAGDRGIPSRIARHWARSPAGLSGMTSALERRRALARHATRCQTIRNLPPSIPAMPNVSHLRSTPVRLIPLLGLFALITAVPSGSVAQGTESMAGAGMQFPLANLILILPRWLSSFAPPTGSGRTNHGSGTRMAGTFSFVA